MKKILLFTMLTLSLIACKSGNVEYKYPKSKEERERKEMGSVLFGKETDDGYSEGLFSSRKTNTNQYLWKAALEVMSFMPISSANSNDGIIITDWYSDKNINERMKFNITILSNQFDSKILKINAFREVKSGHNWIPAEVSPTFTKELENKILVRARQLRIANS